MKKFTEYLKEAYSPGDENEAGMVSNCCGAPIMDVYQGHGRCSDCKEMASAVKEAVGDAADPIYDLIDNHGAEAVLDELVRYLDVDQIEDFVSDYRRHHNMELEMAEKVGETCDHCGCVIENPDPKCDCDHDHNTNEALDYLRKLAGM